MISQRSSVAQSVIPQKVDGRYPSDIHEMVTKVLAELEHRLEVDYGATGKELQEKITSVESFLTPSLMRKLRYLSSFGNKLPEKLTPNVLNRYEFIRNYEEAKDKLKRIVRTSVAADSAIQKCMLGIFLILFLFTSIPNLSKVIF